MAIGQAQGYWALMNTLTASALLRPLQRGQPAAPPVGAARHVREIQDRSDELIGVDRV